MFACEYGSAGRGADGIGYAGIGKEHSHFGQSVDVWRLDQPLIICRNCLIGMVIGHDENDIGSFRGKLLPLLSFTGKNQSDGYNEPKCILEEFHIDIGLIAS